MDGQMFQLQIINEVKRTRDLFDEILEESSFSDYSSTSSHNMDVEV